MKGVGHAPGGPLWDPWSVSLNAPHHKEQEYIWFMGGDLNGFQDIMHFFEVKSDKKYGKDYMKSRCTSSDYGETCAKFQKD